MARPRSVAANAKILSSATALLLEDGLDGFSIDEVSRRSGVAKTTIYRHFTSTNQLVVTACDQMVQPFPTPNTGSLRQDLLDFCALAVPTFSDPNVRPLMLGILSAAASDHELHQIHQSMVKERKAPLQTIVDMAKARGELADDLDFDEAFDFIEGPFVSRWLLDPERLLSVDIEQTIDRVIAALQS